MKIDISDLLRKKIIKKNIDLCFEEDCFYDGKEEIKFLSPIEVKGTLSILENELSLNATAKVKIELNCSRCLEKFDRDMEIHIDEKFSNDDANKDDDCIFIDSDVIDITEIIENNIILYLPIRRLCSESCKGLCQECGTNLNHSSCNCGDEEIDPRLAKLKELF